MVADGVDPSAHRQLAKAARENTFASVAQEWLTLQEKPDIKHRALAPPTLLKMRWMLDSLLSGDWEEADWGTDGADLLGALRRIESRGTLETAHRANQLSTVMRDAVNSKVPC
jgi:hypothetical protein